MNRTQPLHALLAASLAFASIAPAIAFAQPAPAPKDAAEADKKERARALFEKGLQLYNEGAFDAALAEFQRSREIFPSRAATQNAGLALRKLQRFDEALDTLELLLRDFPSLKKEDRDLVEKEIGDLRGLVGSITIQGAAPGATIVIDGRERGVTPLSGPLRVAVGSHMLRAIKEGFSPFESRVEVSSAGSVAVTPKLGALLQAGRLKVVEQGGAAATVLVDNVAVGKTPWEGSLPAGGHVVVLRGEGNTGTQPASAAIRNGQVTALTLATEPLQASLRVEPEPINASVAINGVTVGRGVWEGRLRAGGHRIEVVEDGFLLATREVSLDAGKREVVKAVLDRDPSSKLWRKANPPKLVVELTGGPAFAPLFGGEVADGCSGKCSKGVAVGGLGVLHGAYQLSAGVGFGLDLGYAGVVQKISGRATTLTPMGLGANAATADDQLVLSGLLAGASASFHRGERFPWLVRLGGGVLLGSMKDTRSGTYTALKDHGGGTLKIDPVAESPDARFFYVAPEVRWGYRFGGHFEATIGVASYVLVTLTQPSWIKAHGTDNIGRVFTAKEGGADFPEETLAPKVLVMVTPTLGLRADF